VHLSSGPNRLDPSLQPTTAHVTTGLPSSASSFAPALVSTVLLQRPADVHEGHCRPGGLSPEERVGLPGFAPSINRIGRRCAWSRMFWRWPASAGSARRRSPCRSGSARPTPLPTHHVNALLMPPGGYRVSDYLKAGSLLSLLFVTVSTTIFSFFDAYIVPGQPSNRSDGKRGCRVGESAVTAGYCGSGCWFPSDGMEQPLDGPLDAWFIASGVEMSGGSSRPFRLIEPEARPVRASPAQRGRRSVPFVRPRPCIPARSRKNRSPMGVFCNSGRFPTERETMGRAVCAKRPVCGHRPVAAAAPLHDRDERPFPDSRGAAGRAPIRPHLESRDRLHSRRFSDNEHRLCRPLNSPCVSSPGSS
jgi:hypothetical protein